MSRTSATKKAAARPTSEIAAALAATALRDGAIAKTEVGKHAPRAQVLDVFDALTRAGLEVSGRFVRRPLAAQIEDALRSPSAGALRLRGLEKTVRGATPREIATAAAELAERGRLRIVVRGDEVLLARPDEAVLDARACERLAVIAQELAATLKLAKKKGATLFHADVEAALAPFAGPPRGASGMSGSVAPSAVRDLDALVDANREASGLTSVPKLVRLLGGAAARDAIHGELLRGARAGRFELRPESGMGRLSVEDASLCIPGPQGSRLSWVRRLEERS